MNEWAVSAVTIDGILLSWANAVPLLTSGKRTEAIDIVLAAPAFARTTIEINGRAQENRYREVLARSERLVLSCRNAASGIEDPELRSAAVAQSKVNGGLLERLRACLHRIMGLTGASTSRESPRTWSATVE
jgi:hypothetical protein